MVQIKLENVMFPTSRVKDELMFSAMLLILCYISALIIHFGHQMKAETENIASLIMFPSLDLDVSVDKPKLLQCCFGRY